MKNSCCETEKNTCTCNCSDIPKYRMCKLSQPSGNFDLEKVKKLANDPKYICKCCGRVANKKENLCMPEDLK
jgi:hypothetical protein